MFFCRTLLVLNRFMMRGMIRASDFVTSSDGQTVIAFNFVYLVNMLY